MTTKLRHAATLLTLSALCGAGLLAVTAQAAPEIVRKAPLQVTFDGQITPRSLPRSG